MTKPGPKPGWKKAAAAQPAAAVTPPQPAAPVVAPIDPPPAPVVQLVPPVVLSAADRENPDKLTGEALRTLAHRRGLARSAIDGMADDKIRTELRYLTHRQYEAA